MSAIASTAGRCSGASESASSRCCCAAATSPVASNVAREVGERGGARLGVARRRELPLEHLLGLVPMPLGGEQRRERAQRLRVRRILGEGLFEAGSGVLGQRELLAVDARGVEQGGNGAGLAAQRARLAHARLGIGLKIVGLEVEPRERREGRGVLGRGLERRLDLGPRRLGIVEVVEPQERQLERQLGDAAALLDAAAGLALDLDALLEHPRRLVGEARAAQVAQQDAHELVVSHGVDAELPQRGRGGLGVRQLVLEDARASTHELDACVPARERRAPAERLLEVFEATVRLLQLVERGERVGVVGRLREERPVRLDGAVRLIELGHVDVGDAPAQLARAHRVLREIGVALQALDDLGPHADARIQTLERRERLERLVGGRG
jgi:hypothetical protein